MELPNLQTSFTYLNGQQRTGTTKYRQTDCTGDVSLPCNSLSLSSSSNRRLCHVEQSEAESKHLPNAFQARSEIPRRCSG